MGVFFGLKRARVGSRQGSPILSTCILVGAPGLSAGKNLVGSQRHDRSICMCQGAAIQDRQAHDIETGRSRKSS